MFDQSTNMCIRNAFAYLLQVTPKIIPKFDMLVSLFPLQNGECSQAQKRFVVNTALCRVET